MFMANKKNDKLAWGISLLAFGCLFLIKQLHILPDGIASVIFDTKNYPLLMGIIFLLFHSYKSVGYVLIAVGLLFRISDIIRITQHVSDYIWPILLMISGLILIFGFKKGK
jgi:hypothetical protein